MLPWLVFSVLLLFSFHVVAVVDVVVVDFHVADVEIVLDVSVVADVAVVIAIFSFDIVAAIS